MNQNNIIELLSQIYNKGIKPLFIDDSHSIYIKDPVFPIKRNRVIAETVKTLLRTNIEENKEIIKKLCNYLIDNQLKDGSWNEIHPNYQQPSSLITAIVADSLLKAYKEKIIENEATLKNANNFILSNQIKPGFFLKSTHYTADHPNVNATCGAYLSYYARVFSNNESLKAAKNVTERISLFQKKDGMLPYTTDKGSYPVNLNIPCLHYQAVTIFYLIKIQQNINDEKLQMILDSGTRWLAKRFNTDGSLNWKESGLLFSYYLTGAYAYAYACFDLMKKTSSTNYQKEQEKILFILKNNMKNNLLLRWQHKPGGSIPRNLHVSFETAKLGNYPMREKLFRLAYANYRQIARNRIKDKYSDGIFQMSKRILRLKTSTIESSTNYPDLFMTTEAIDCLSSTLQMEG